MITTNTIRYTTILLKSCVINGLLLCLLVSLLLFARISNRVYLRTTVLFFRKLEMNNILQMYMDMPPVTRIFTTACVVTSLAVQFDFVTPFHLYFNWELIIKQWQIWRLFTSFFYFGSMGIPFVFNMIFTYRYCQMLEEGSFHGRTADFVFMFLFGGFLMVLGTIFVHMIFLGQAFTIMLVYVWSRRNPSVQMNFFGFLSFTAPYLPWVLLLFSLLLGNNALVDFMGIACGHIYFFLEDVFPHQPHGMKLLNTPAWLHWLCDERRPEPVPVEERPGGFDWGVDDEAHDHME